MKPEIRKIIHKVSFLKPPTATLSSDAIIFDSIISIVQYHLDYVF